MQIRTRLNVSRGIRLATIGLLASIEFACTSSQLTNVWKNPEFKNAPMRNMLVIAAKKSPVGRRIWEDVIAAELSARGVSSTPSYTLFTDSIPNPDQVGAAVREKKFDGVLFIRKLPTEVSTNYFPGTV